MKEEVRNMAEMFSKTGLSGQAPVSIETMSDSQIRICMLEGIPGSYGKTSAGIY